MGRSKKGTTADKRKRTFYFPSDILEEMEAVAERYSTPVSRVLRDCFILVTNNLDRMIWVEGTTIFGPELKGDPDDDPKAD
ncbi:MAG: hypothetical protein ACYTBJ_00470 [Planctomycetota bacterium]|jgi:hypothetical protein